MQRQLTLDVFVTPADRRAAMLADIRAGLTATPMSVPPVWFYDETGSRLFDEITRLPEYYLTRTERSILAEHAASIAALADADTLVEIGSGTSEKTRLLLDAMAARGSLRHVVLFDISEEVLREAAGTLAAAYGVTVHAIVGDFRVHLPRIPGGTRRLWAFLGSTLGNLTGKQRSRLLFDLQTSMDPTDRLLIGSDLVKAPERLVAAYDDAAGVTARFNLNLLTVLNRELHAGFDPAAFEHVAVWNAEREWIEMRLRATAPQRVRLEDLDLTVSVDAGDYLLTEVSAKFRPETLAEEFTEAGLVVERVLHDPARDFQLTLLKPYC